MGLEKKKTNTKQLTLGRAYWGCYYLPFTQPVPCLRIFERPIRVPSDQDTRWRLPFTQKPRNQSKVAVLRREGATVNISYNYEYLTTFTSISIIRIR